MSRRCESSLTRFDLSFGEHLRLLVTPKETHDNSDKALRHLYGRDLRMTVLEMMKARKNPGRRDRRHVARRNFGVSDGVFF
jgi:hypothetical protein